jgi:hypothetical protein
LPCGHSHCRRKGSIFLFRPYMRVPSVDDCSELLAEGGMSWSVCSTPGGRARSRARENATAAATDQGAWRHSIRVSSQFVRRRNP